MNRKHFNALAAEIRTAYADACSGGGEEARTAVANLAGRIARVCADSNPNFSDARFIKACGIGSTEVIPA